uniref:Ig-like domain-containing protein n=1 Tax=Lepisosteus oculatus TaxID=7918 RepID=W5LZM1_LEPOC
MQTCSLAHLHKAEPRHRDLRICGLLSIVKMQQLAFTSLLISLVLPCVRSDIVLTQPSQPEIKKPGETVKLSCRVSGFTLSSSYYMHWIRQAPGRTFEWLLYIRGDNADISYAQSIQGRALASTDRSTTAYLELRSLQTDDTALYYCARQSR